MKVAVISDIHGNRLALEAVLADMAAEGIDAAVNLGDVVSGPMAPREVVDILLDADLPTVRGNHDRQVSGGPDGKMDRVDRFAFDQLEERHRGWLGSLPATLAINGELFLCHGTPRSDTDPWLDTWWRGRTTTYPDEATVAAEAEGLAFPVLLCGHTHLPRVVRLRDGRLIVNPGSVGLQFHLGCPDARYAIIERRAGTWAVSLRTVPYDAEGAAAEAEANGFPRWRTALTTGWVGAEGLFS